MDTVEEYLEELMLTEEPPQPSPDFTLLPTARQLDSRWRGVGSRRIQGSLHKPHVLADDLHYSVAEGSPKSLGSLSPRLGKI